MGAGGMGRCQGMGQWEQGPGVLPPRLLLLPKAISLYWGQPGEAPTFSDPRLGPLVWQEIYIIHRCTMSDPFCLYSLEFLLPMKGTVP